MGRGACVSRGACAAPHPTPTSSLSSGGRLDAIINTHHHHDHVGGNLALKQKYGATVVGPKADAGRIPGIDVALADGDALTVGSINGVCLDVPGHTRGHVAFHFPAARAAFVGDTLFALGCGRLFGGWSVGGSGKGGGCVRGRRPRLPPHTPSS